MSTAILAEIFIDRDHQQHILRRSRNAAVLFLAFCFLAAASSPAIAVTLTWITFGNGNFNDENNWFSEKVPDVNDFVSFEVGSGNPYTVTFPGNELIIGGGEIANYTTSHLRVRDNGVTFSGSTQPFRTASTYTVASTTQTEANRGIIIGVGSGENASLSISHSGFTGGILSSFSGVAATIGDAAGCTGTLNVNVGAFNVTGSNFTETQLIVGNNGTGTLNVNSGADVNVTGFNSKVSLGHHATGVGTVTISGAGSTWTNSDQFWVGESGVGTLTIQNGGSLITSSSAGNSNVIGTFAGGSGTATVTGAGSTWTYSNELRVGNSGDGALTVSNGGSLISNTGAFTDIGGGTNASGSVTVTGAGSTWNTAGTIQVGSTGAGSLAILNGGTVTSGRGQIRGLNAGSGQVLVAGAGSTWNVTNELVIGLPEPGFTTGPTTLTINPGGSVNVGQDIDLDTNGVLRLQGGTLTAASIGSRDLLSMQYEGVFEWTAGTLHVGTVHGNATNQGGTLAPGQSAGRTTIDGNYTQQAAGVLEIEIGGIAPETQHDFVSVEGFAALNGQLQLNLINGFVPTALQTFTVLDTLGGITDAFSNVANGQRLGTVDGNGSFFVHYGAGSAFNPNQIVLTGFAVAIPGDFDSDGDVDGADFVIWQTNFPTAMGAMLDDGDADGDGDVDGADFVVWQTNFPTTPGPATAPVPEPPALFLLAGAIFALAGPTLGSAVFRGVVRTR